MSSREAGKKTLKENLLTAVDGGDILFIVPPLARNNSCALGVHVLQQIAKKNGFEAKVLYLNKLLTTLLGTNTIDEIFYSPVYWMLKERLFARSAYNLPALGSNPDACNNQLLSIFGNDNESFKLYFDKPAFDVNHFKIIEDVCYGFIHEITEIIAQLNFKIIGLTFISGQVNACISIIDKLKKYAPDSIIIAGGDNCTCEMAKGIESLTDSIDYIFSGESEITFQSFLNNWKNNQSFEKKIFESICLNNLDDIELPDYSDFITQADKFPESKDDMELWYEISRGCIWVKSKKCNFCGISNDKYRHKSAQKVYDDFIALEKTCKNGKLHITDNMMPPVFHKTFIPKIQGKHMLHISYMQRLPISYEQMKSMKESGIKTLLPGIETLSTELLKLMNKGIKCKDNLLFLRNANIVNIRLFWFFIWAIPGDKIKYYEEILQLIPLIMHFQPPSDLLPVEIYRFSNYFNSPEEFGLKNLNPWNVYSMIFPTNADIQNLTYYHAAEYQSESLQNPKIISRLHVHIKQWQQNWQKCYLQLIPNPMFPTQYIIIDKRNIEEKEKIHSIDFKVAKEIMVSRKDNNKTTKWAIDNKLGVIIDNWYVPLITCSETLMDKFSSTKYS